MSVSEQAVALAASATTGLSAQQIEDRRGRGDVNVQPERTSRRYRDIVASNVFTRFNAIISILAGVVLAVGEPVDALFAIIMVINALVGIVQEARAKHTLDRLQILVAPAVSVRRDGSEIEIPPGDVVLDEIVVLRVGDQVPVDGEIVEATTLELDESALTGEADPVMKRHGDEVLSGSAVVAGSAVIAATRVGESAWIHRLVAQAKEYVLAESELRSGVDQILRAVGWAIGPLAALLVWSQLRANESTSDGLVSAVAGVTGLVPQGLVLLVSMSMAVAVIRLARQHVLVQELAAVEGLARVDVLCVDKTGTLTTGRMRVESIEALDDDPETARLGLAALAEADPDPTTTLQVIAQHLSEMGIASPERSSVVHHVPFSSARKWSGATFVTRTSATSADTQSWVLGAPEVVLDRSGDGERVSALIDVYLNDARRVVLLASASEPLSDTSLPANVVPRAIIALSEEVRPDVGETMEYFRQQQVEIKVISGDNPDTVSAVASHAGIEGADQRVDMRTVDSDDVGRSVDIEQTTVFGRVSPEQKRAIVAALQAAGHTVAMTGDGVNDIPALKLADIGIAVDTATPATKAISQLVLLDGRFDRMPHVVSEGRRVIANMERVSNLFVTKTVYAALFALSIGLSGSIFPFLPRHMSLVSTLTIGVPAFLLSFRASNQPCRAGYFRRVLRFAVPAGTSAAVVTLAAYWVARSPVGDATLDQARSMSTLALTTIALWVLYVLMRPLDRWDRGLLGVMIAAAVAVYVTPPLRDLFRLEIPPTRTAVLVAAIVGGSLVIAQLVLRWRTTRRA